MAEEDVGSLVVIDSGKRAGVDVPRIAQVDSPCVGRRASISTSPVADVAVRELMVTNPQVVAPDMGINDLRRLMIDTHSRYLPVMDDDPLMGVVSHSTMSQGCLRRANVREPMLKAYIGDFPADG